MNILKVGTSIIEIDRIEKVLKKSGLLGRMFTAQELKQLAKIHFNPHTVAKLYCAKMALARAMGYNFRGCRYNEISVLIDMVGSPYISRTGNAKTKFSTMNCNISVSICRSKKYASATVILFSK